MLLLSVYTIFAFTYGYRCAASQHSSRSDVGAGSEYMAILYHTRKQAAPLQHLCSPDILIRSGDMVDDLDIIEED